MQELLKQLGIGGVIGAFGGLIGLIIGGIGVFFTGPIPFGLYLLVSFFFLWIFWHTLFGPMIRTNEILNIGEAAEAKILAIRENGSSLQVGGSIPKAGITFTLEVHRVNQPPYTTEVEMFVSPLEFSSYRVGAILPIKVHPLRPMEVALIPATPLS